MTTCLDDSVLSATATCSTYAVMRYVLHYTNEEESAPARCGTDIHRALAAYFSGAGVEASMDILRNWYKPFADENIPEGDRLCWSNVKNIIEEYFETHPIEKLPFEIIKEGIETVVKAPLCEGIEFYALLDLPVREKATKALYVCDHKTTGKVTSWWAKKFRLGSQLTGYTWAMGVQYNAVVTGAFVNAIEIGKLPNSKKKCRTHGVPYFECSKQHTKFDLFVTGRSPEQIISWKEDATILAKRFQGLKQVYQDINMIQAVFQEGVFNNGCTFCEMKDFCASGRQPELADAMLIRKIWSPWDLDTHLKFL